MRTGGLAPANRRSRGNGRAMRVWLACAACMWASHLADAGSLSPERRREILGEALDAFDQAVAATRDDPADAERLYRQSVTHFETLIDDGVANAPLFYNLGNAYFRLGKLGRAIANYRRAQLLDPGDAEIAANLKYARNRVEPYIKPTGGQQLIARLMFWTNHTSMQYRFWLAAIASAVGWLLLVIRLVRRSRPLAIVATLLILLGLANAVSVGWQLRDESRRPPAVVIGGEHTLRLGRGEGYDAALSQPLGPGVELRIITHRGDWVEVRLRDGQTGWLRASAVLQI